VAFFDPQQTENNRFAALLTFHSHELIPLLPIPLSSKLYRFKQVDWVVQVDSYKYGGLCYRVLRATASTSRAKWAGCCDCTSPSLRLGPYREARARSTRLVRGRRVA
jgi:hypothetical protein